MKVNDARLGRSIAGLVTRGLVVKEVVRREKEICLLVVNSGKRGVKEYCVCIKGRHVSCNYKDYRERSVNCKHIAAVTLHELGATAQARS